MTSGEEKKPPLFSAFEPVSPQQWQETIVKDLKGEHPDSLLWHPEEGLTVKPFYRREDLEAVPPLASRPGDFPYRRGHKTSHNGWLSIQDIRVTASGAREAVDKAVEALQRGADGVHFLFSSPANFDTSYLIRQVNLTKTPVSFTVSEGTDAFAASLLAEVNQQGNAVSFLTGFLHQPLQEGGDQRFGPEAIQRLARLVEETQEAEGFKVITIDGAAFRNKGSSLIQEIALVASAAVAYLDKLTDQGLSLSAVVPKLQVLLSAGPDYFLEIAKFRAFRLVWATVLKAYGAESMAGLLRVHATTSRWHQTTFDPHTNLLRATTEVMAALLGGCDSLSVEPFDSTFQVSGPFSERLARNILLILKEEAYLDKIVDPAAGSYYLETLTDQMARQAWALFQEVETRGGFPEPAATEFIRGEINRVSKVKYANIASGKEVIVGTNRFPNLQEELPFDPEQLIQSKEFDTSRGPYSFEVMRLAAELHHRKRKGRPVAAIAVLGDSIERHVNASFAREFFSCANFDTQVLSFETVQTAAAALLALPAKVIVLSASSGEFAQFGQQFGPLLRKHPHRPALILASDPAVMKEEMIASGFDEFIFEGCDTKEIIARIQEKLMQEKE